MVIGRPAPSARRSSRSASAAAAANERSMRRTRKAIDAGRDPQLAVGEMLDQHGGEQRVVGRRDRHHRQRAQPRGEIGQARSARRPAPRAATEQQAGAGLDAAIVEMQQRRARARHRHRRAPRRASCASSAGSTPASASPAISDAAAARRATARRDGFCRCPAGPCSTSARRRPIGPALDQRTPPRCSRKPGNRRGRARCDAAGRAPAALIAARSRTVGRRSAPALGSARAS